MDREDNLHRRKYRCPLLPSLAITADLRSGSSPSSLPHPPVIKHSSDKLMLTLLPSSRAMLLTDFTAPCPRLDATDHHYIHTMNPWLSSSNHLTKWTGSLGQKAIPSTVTELLFRLFHCHSFVDGESWFVCFFQLFIHIILPSINYKPSLRQGDVEESCPTFCRKSASIPGPALRVQVVIMTAHQYLAGKKPFLAVPWPASLWEGQPWRCLAAAAQQQTASHSPQLLLKAGMSPGCDTHTGPCTGHSSPRAQTGKGREQHSHPTRTHHQRVHRGGGGQGHLQPPKAHSIVTPFCSSSPGCNHSSRHLAHTLLL